eukprot:scaffold294918_cov35-Prasinocladus_malaysianus.AAC.1
MEMQESSRHSRSRRKSSSSSSPLASAGPERKLKLALGPARGLRELHDRMGILHRDVKSSNFVFRDETELVLIDFGMAISKSNLAPSSGGVESAFRSLRGDASSRTTTTTSAIAAAAAATAAGDDFAEDDGNPATVGSRYASVTAPQRPVGVSTSVSTSRSEKNPRPPRRQPPRKCSSADLSKRLQQA